MICPHCQVAFHTEPREPRTDIGDDVDGKWWVWHPTCPECGKITMALTGYDQGGRPTTQYFFRPLMAKRKTAIHEDVTGSMREDYEESCRVLPSSAKASAALSRRCLQNLLAEKTKTKKRDLFDQIQEVIDSNELPSYLAESIDGIRNIGAFAAHPIKSKSSGEIVDVEPGEAEWNLDTLEGLFDHYCAKPAELAEHTTALNKKLADVGKPDMKDGSEGEE